LVWGQNFNILESGSRLEHLPTVVHETVVQTLIQINEVLERATTIGGNYGLTRKSVQPAIERDEAAAVAEITRQGTPIAKVHKSYSLFRRMIWTGHDRGRFHTLVEHLRRYIDALYDFVPVETRKQLTFAVEARQLAQTVLHEGREGVQVLQRAAQQNRDPSLQRIAQLSIERDSAIQLQTLQNANSFQNQPAWQCELSFRQVEIFHRQADTPSTRSFGALRNNQRTRLIIEWRTYSPVTLQEMSKHDLQLRVEALAKHLAPRPRPDVFRILDCQGYFEDNSAARFGLLFSYPLNFNSSQALDPISLFQLLQREDRVPLLGDRFALAGVLAESLFSFMAAGWLHKCINSHDVLFFRDSMKDLHGGSHIPSSLNDPYLTGFALSRPNGTDIATSRRVPVSMGLAIYRHPDVIGLNGEPVGRYQTIHDIYSFGTVLLEIGTWVGLEKRYIPGSSARTFQSQLISAAVPQLGPSMGESYMTAVNKCLTGRFDNLANFFGHEPDYDLNLQDAFSREVIQVIKSCHV
jgi:Prion-inhibition and propagation